MRAIRWRMAGWVFTVEHTVAYGQAMATLTAHDWVLAAMRRLSTHGVDHIRVEPLAVQLGVSKGSFYWHFPNRDALLTAVLDLWQSQGTEAIITAVDAEPPGSEARLHVLIQQTFGQPQHDGIELGIRAWATRDATARTVVEKVDARRLDYVTGLLRQYGLSKHTARTRAELMYRTLIGEFTLRSHGHPPLDAAALQALLAAMVAPHPSTATDSGKFVS